MPLLTNNGIALTVAEHHVERLSNFTWYYTTGVVKRMEHYGNLHLNFPLANEVLQIDRRIKIDHKDRNPLNNLEDNLRIATPSQNMANRAKQRRKCSSIYKGVSFRKYNLDWESYIMKNRKRIHLGIFKDEKEAALAYNKAAIELFGEFALLNIV